MNRRTAALLLGGAGAGLLASTGVAAPSSGSSANLPTQDPAFTFRTWARLNADLSGRVLYMFQGGMVYGFRPQSDDVTLEQFGRRLYGYRSCTVRKATAKPDGTVLIRSRSWFFYTEAESGKYIDKLLNPYTDKIVDCSPRMTPITEQLHSQSGPRIDNAPFPFESSEAGRPFQFDYSVMGEHVWIRRNGFTRFKPSDTTWWKLEGDMLTHTAKLADVLNSRLTHIPNTTSHNLVAEWQTWMNMHGSPGHILFVGNGAFTPSPRALPDHFRHAVDERFPGSLAEPAAWS